MNEKGKERMECGIGSGSEREKQQMDRLGSSCSLLSMMWQLNILGWVGLCHILDFGVENQTRILKWGEIYNFPLYFRRKPAINRCHRVPHVLFNYCSKHWH
jgi:hypothetical protein